MQAMSTRFPYTTLFRSVFDAMPLAAPAPPAAPEPAAPDDAVPAAPAPPAPEVPVPAAPAPPAPPAPPVLPAALPAVEDRKSTRLNSSHVEISYAVFCLK